MDSVSNQPVYKVVFKQNIHSIQQETDSCGQFRPAFSILLHKTMNIPYTTFLGFEDINRQSLEVKEVCILEHEVVCSLEDIVEPLEKLMNNYVKALLIFESRGWVSEIRHGYRSSMMAETIHFDSIN